MEIIGRGVVAAAVLAAVLAGGATGLGLHAWRPDPLAAALGTTDRTSPDPSGTAGDDTSATAKSTPGRSGSPTPDGSTSPSTSRSSSDSTPRASDSASASNPSSTPAFTRLALFRTTDFTTHGWAVARVTNSYPRLPDPSITPCTTITTDDPGVQIGYAGSWASEHTEAVEVVARYRNTDAAEKAFSRALDMITNCDSTDYEPKVQVSGFARTASADGVDDIRWFNTRASSDNDTLGVLGVVRAEDRIAVVELSSSDTDPDDTHKGGSTDIAAILGIAGRRLV